MQITKTKFGYFPCDKTTFQRIKRLHGYYNLAVQMLASWNRWNTKQAKNRITEAREYQDGKTTITSVSPRPEPKLMPVFCQKSTIVSHFDSNGRFSNSLTLVQKASLCDMGIPALYEQVRIPRKYTKNLPEMTFSDYDILSMLIKIEKEL